MSDILPPQIIILRSRFWPPIENRWTRWWTELDRPLQFLALLIPVLAFALALRLIGLERRGIWFDEGVSVIIAQRDVAALLAATRLDVHPPLYYLLLHFWLLFGSGDFWLRLPLGHSRNGHGTFDCAGRTRVVRRRHRIAGRSVSCRLPVHD